MHVTHLDPVPPTRLQPRVPRDLETICLKCLRKEPPRRYGTALELAEDLQRFLDDKPILARPLSVRARLGRWCARNPTIAALSAAILLLLILATIGSLAAAFKIEGARQLEEVHRLRAEQQAEESRQAAVRLEVNHGIRHLETRDLARALPWFAGALEMEEGDPAREERHRLRLAAVLRHYPKLVQVWLHSGAVPQAVLSPDGKTAATISADTTARLWDTQTGESIGAPLRHPLPLEAAAFSPSGRFLAVAGSDPQQKRGLVWVWEVASLRLVTGPLEHRSTVTGLSFGADEKLLATASWDMTARVWEIPSGRPRTEPLPHPVELWDVTFRPGTHQIFTISDSTVRGWDGDTGRPLPVSFKHPGRVEYVSFSADGNRMAIGSLDGTARVWNPATGEAVSPPLHCGANTKVALITPDGERTVTSSGDGVQVWEVATGRAISPPIRPQAAAFYVAWDREARHIVTGSAEVAQVWDAETGEPLCPPLKHNGIVSAVAFLPDGHRILTACGNTAQIWDLAAGETPVQPLRHPTTVVHAALSPNGGRAVTIGDDRSVRVWNTATGEALNLKSEVFADAVAFSPDGERMVLAMGDAAQVWSVTTGEPLTPLMKHAGTIDSVAFSPDGSKIATASGDQTARTWDAATGLAISPPLLHRGKVLQAAFSPDNQLLATASEDHTARIWDAATGAAKTPALQHDGFVGTVRFSPDGRLLVTAGAGRAGRIWNVTTGSEVTTPLKHLAFARDAIFSPDGRLVATGSYDQTARIWQVTNGQPLTPPLKHGGLVDMIQFRRDGKYLLTISRDRAVQVWEAATGDPLTPRLYHAGLVHTAAFDRDGLHVITISGNALVRRWPLDLKPDRRPVTELVNQSHLLDGHYIDTTGGFMPLEPSAFHADWQRLRSKYPADFTVSEQEARAWQDRIAAERALRSPPRESPKGPESR
jgi:eukaryotic-like serine/threonine-protein kinase